MRLPRLALLVPLLAGLAVAAEPDCRIEPYRRLELKSPVAATIVAIHAERGAPVQPGQWLVQLDSADLDAALATAQYKATLWGPLRQAQLHLEAARERLRLAEDGDQAAAAKRDVALAEAELQSAREMRKLAALEVKQIEAQQAGRRLASPIAGVVAERLQQPGELARPDAPILILEETGRMRVLARLPQSSFGRIRQGSRVQVNLEAPGQGRHLAPHLARIVAADSRVDKGAFTIYLDLPNPRGDIAAGMACSLNFNTFNTFDRLQMRPAGR